MSHRIRSDVAVGDSETVSEFESKYHGPNVQGDQNNAVHGETDFQIISNGYCRENAVKTSKVNRLNSIITIAREFPDDALALLEQAYKDI